MPWSRIDVVLWAILAVVWVAAAPFSRKTVRSETFASRARYIVPALLFSALWSRRLLDVPWLDARWLPDAPWVGALSVAITASGVAFTLWARFTLGKNWSGTVTVKQDHELVRHGPYGITRHPIYTGGVIALTGTVLALGTARTALIVPFAIGMLWSKMRVEERFMSEEFGDAYADYRRRMKMLIPFLW
jgi:protein-S-isoprenylcysteine O-methyltransferase Ste14